MNKKKLLSKYLFTFLMILTVVLATAVVTSAYSDTEVDEAGCAHGSVCSAECEDLSCCEEHSATLPYAMSAKASVSKNPDNYPYPTRNLIYSGGSKADAIGDDVRWLQSVLVHLGYDLEVDGSYGPITRDTIKKFQKAYGLTVDGMSGPKTRPKLKAVWQSTGHTWDSGTVTKQPAVGVSGIKTYKCIYCESVKTGFIAPLQGPAIPAEKTYKIADRVFKNSIDFYAEFLNSSVYDPEFSNMLAALSSDAYKPDKIQEAYRSLGFTQNVRIAQEYNTANPNKCGYNIGLKKSEYSDSTICLIAIRGSKTTSDWIGDFNIDTTVFGGKHVGFMYPAYDIYDAIKEMLGNNVSSDKIKYVITGHSRGAAVGNLLSVELMERGVKESNIHNYNYACPDVACKYTFKSYGNIFNLCNRPDAVPLLPGPICSAFTSPGTSWGKYGKTYWFTSSCGRFDFIEHHSMERYLSFFNSQRDIGEWPKSTSDDIADVLRFTAGIVAKIFCPVDAVVTDENGNVVASIINGEVNYYNDSYGKVMIFTEGDRKLIYVNEEEAFNIDLIGTDTGTMTYSVEKCDLSTGEVYESKTFSNVALESGKTMYCPVSEAENMESVELFVVEEKNGKKVYTHSIGIDGVEEEVSKTGIIEFIKNIPEKTKKIILYVLGGIVVLSLLDAMTGRKKKKKKKKQQNPKA